MRKPTVLPPEWGGSTTAEHPELHEALMQAAYFNPTVFMSFIEPEDSDMPCGPDSFFPVTRIRVGTEGDIKRLQNPYAETHELAMWLERQDQLLIMHIEEECCLDDEDTFAVDFYLQEGIARQMSMFTPQRTNWNSRIFTTLQSMKNNLAAADINGCVEVPFPIQSARARECFGITREKHCYGAPIFASARLSFSAGLVYVCYATYNN